jgi:hypothetical protein
MKLSRLFPILVLAATLPCRAGDEATNKSAQEPEVQAASSLKMAYEVDARYGYVGDSRTEIGRGRTGNIDEQEALFRAVLTPRWGEGPVFRFGVAAQRFSFGLPDNAILPNTLQSTALIVGLDFSLGESWLVRVEAQPGLYSDFNDIDRGDINVPFQIGATYIASSSLQFVVALAVNFDHRWPVIPVVGLRWKIAGPLTLNAILPNPRLEYEVRDGVTLFAGADVRSITYRVSEDFGDSHGVRRLNDAIVEYDEVRVGAGISWKAAPGVTIEAEAGYLPYREFDFHRADVNFETKTGGIYGQLAVSAKF